MPREVTSNMARLGFRCDKGRPHVGRSIMLIELERLLTYKDADGLVRADYATAIVEDNCLGKRSRQARIETFKRLTQFYGLDAGLAVFRALLYFWHRDKDAHRLLALICAHARDGLLVGSAPLVLLRQPGESLSSADLAEALAKTEPGHYTTATLEAAAARLRSSWTQSGHLVGTRKRVRSLVAATPGAAAFAVFLGYLCGIRGEVLLDTEFTALLDTSSTSLLSLVEQAAERGWLVLNQVGSVFEVLFPKLVCAEELV